MSKTLEALSTFYRLLILVAATVLTVAIYYQPVPYRFSRALEKVNQIEKTYSQVIGELKANATDKYRDRLLRASSGRSKSPHALTTTAQFMPSQLKIIDEQGVERVLNIENQEISLNDLLYVVAGNLRGSYSLALFDKDAINRFFKSAADDRILSPLYAADDLTIYVQLPVASDPDVCVLSFRSDKWEQRSRLPRYLPIGCRIETEQDVSDVLRASSINTWQSDAVMPSVPYNLASLPHRLARDKIAALATAETQDEKVELLGPKLTIVGLLNVGPILIITILFLMLGQTRTIYLLPEKEPAEGGVWFGQFLGWPVLTAFAVLCLLPVLATATALSAGYARPYDLPDNLSWWAPKMLWSQRWFISGTLVVTILSFWLLVANVRASWAWRARLRGQASVPTG